MNGQSDDKQELEKILQKLSEIKEEIVRINVKTESNHKWLSKLARRILPISIAVTVIEILILCGIAAVVYFTVKFFFFSEAGKSLIKFISNFAS